MEGKKNNNPHTSLDLTAVTESPIAMTVLSLYLSTLHHTSTSIAHYYGKSATGTRASTNFFSQDRRRP